MASWFRCGFDLGICLRSESVVFSPTGSVVSRIQANRIQLTQDQPTFLRCRFEMTGVDTPSSGEFCVFEFPGCEGCPNALHAVKTVGRSEDPMKSKVGREWIARASRPRK
jgi:hypothetical protein